MPNKSTSVSVIGLGPMGAPIAHSLLAAGREVTVWNRTSGVSAPFADRGAIVAAKVVDAAADVILSVLPDIDQLRTLLDDSTLNTWASRARPPRLVVMSTTSPNKVKALADDLANLNIHVADAPMSGGDVGARDKSLSIMVGAYDSDWEIISPILHDIGSTIVRFGRPGAGSVAKLCNQVVVAGTLTSLAEAFGLAEHAGLDLEALDRVFSDGLASSKVLDAKREKLLDHEYSLGGSATNQLKDLRYAISTARHYGAPAPLTQLLASQFQTINDLGRGHEDHSVVLELYRQE